MTKRLHLTPNASQKSTLLASASLGLGLLLLSACSSAPARDADTYYDMQPDIAPVTFQSDKTLKLQSVSVKGLQSGRSLVIEKATNPVQYQEVRGHLWHVAPSTLIENAISESLMAASQDLLIGTSETVDNEDMRLRIVVRKFHFTPAQNAHLAFAAVIKDRSGKIISSTNYDISEPITGSGYESAVLALEKAMSQAIEDLVSDIKKVI